MDDKDRRQEKDEVGGERKPLLNRARDLLSHPRLGNTTRKLATFGSVVVIVALVVFGMRVFYLNTGLFSSQPQAVTEESPPQTPSSFEEKGGSGGYLMPSFEVSRASYTEGLRRIANLHTSIPSRPRVDVRTYTVKQGDSVFGIADKFGLKPETILWGNFETLKDNPHSLRPGQELNILPVNGTYHKWREGESLIKVAEYYGVDPMDIVEWPGNAIDIYDFDIENPDIEPGTMLIVPGGERELIDYGPPAITRDNPAIARTYGPGHCGEIYQGPVGVGVFIWPTIERWLSGYDYNPSANHPAIDIAGDIGNNVWASDTGVVVYSGWSNHGYGNLVVIDHGNGWQTLYSHLHTISVRCGQGVNQGQPIGTLGSTGNSTGPHLHFEMIYNGQKVNPWDFLQ
ncbi:MAG: peptidoglycan DD-metalloendopeptidase family protein [Anaerolineales bacterium]